jgi:hypothetical protein
MGRAATPGRRRSDREPCLLIREAAQHLAIALQQGCDRVRQARFCGLRQPDAAAASIGRVGCPPDQPVSLHAGEHLRHWGLLDSGEAGEVTLRACPAVLKRNQHRQVADAEAQRLQTRLAQAGKASRCEADQVPRRREHIQFHVRHPLYCPAP